tara:strand:- start:5719 stop:7155 length:1437 start_codon:yes stop_codon:yes gene_type:complete
VRPEQSSEHEGFRLLGIGTSLAGLAFAGAASWLLTAISMVWLARKLGAHEFGLMNMGLAVASCAVALTAPNLNVWGSRAIVRNEGAVGDVMVAVKVPQIALAIAIAATLTIGAYLFLPAKSALVIGICSCTIVSNAMGLQWVAQGIGKLRYIAANQLISSLVFFLIVLVAVRSSSDLWGGPVGLAAGQIVAAGALLVIFIRMGLVGRLHLRFAGLPKGSVPGATYAVTSITAVINQYGGFIAVSIFSTATALGLYSAAARIYLTVMLVSALITTVFFPILSKYNHTDRRMAGRVVIFWIGGAALIGGLPAALLLGAPTYFIDLVLGADYAGAQNLIRLAAIGIFGNLIMTAYSMAVLAAGNDRAYLTASLVSAGVTLICGALTAVLGVAAAGAGLAIMDFALLICVLPAFRRAYDRMHLSVLFLALGALAAGGVLFSVLHREGIGALTGVAVGSAGYLVVGGAGALLLIQAFRKRGLL